MKEEEELNQAIAALEAQRHVLGNRVVDAAQAGLREKLASLVKYAPTSRQRRLVTVIFVDIANSTALSQGLEPEEVRAVMGGALKRLTRPVEAYSGQVIQFAGDGFVAVFGLIKTHENDARQAVRAGLDILAEARTFAKELEQSRNLPGFNVRVGINTGRVVAGRFSQGESPVMGLTVSLASRLEEASQAGSVLISQFTYQHVRGAFDVEALEPLTAKGFPQPVCVYRVQAARPRTFRTFTRGVEGIETRLVGRDTELAQLQQIFTHATQDRQTSMVTIRGEAGVGKSRLLYEFDRWVAQRPSPVIAFKARSSPQMIDVPYSMLREMISYRLGVLITDPADLTRRCLVDALSEVLEDEPEMKAHFVGAMLGFDFSGSPYLRGMENNPEQLSRRGQFYLSQYFQAVVDKSPTVFMLDDIHWADAPSMSYLTEFMRQFPQLPLLVICLGRPPLAERFPGLSQAGASVDQISPKPEPLPGSLLLAMGPLSRASSSELLGEILRNVEALPEALSQQILDRAEGNPFYLEEFIQTLVDTKVIHPDPHGDRWKLDSARLGRLDMPETLVALLEARLDNLSTAQRALLQQAAVIGAVFWRSALQAVQGERAITDDELGELAKRGFIISHEPSTFEGTEEYHFHHAMLHDVAYQALLKPDRMSCHGKVANWLIETTQGAGRVSEFTPVIAEHYESAGERQLAAEWFTQSGEHARRQGAPAQAHLFFNHALSLLPPEVSSSTPAADLARLWQALAGRNEVLGILGDTAARVADDNALVDLASLIGDDHLLAEAYYRQGYYLGVRGQYRQEWEAYLRGLAAARHVKDYRREALILSSKMACEVRLGDLERAAQTSKLALVGAEQLADDLVLARSLLNVSVYYTEMGDMARAAHLLGRALDIYHRIGFLEDEALGLCNLGYNYIQLGMIDEGISNLNRCIVVAQTINHRRCQVYGSLNLALGYLRRDDPSAVLKQLEPCMPELLAINDRFGYAAGHTYTALAREQSGQIDAACIGFEKAIETLQEIGAYDKAQDAVAGVTRCLLAHNDLETAQQNAYILWNYLLHHSGAGLEFPVLAYETCANAFAAVGQATLARRAVGSGYGELILRAGRISLPEMRRSFMENLPEHQRIRQRWQEYTQSI